MKPALVLIGPGRVGCAFSRRLREAGYPIAAVISRDQKRALEAARFIGCGAETATTDIRLAAQGDILLLALPDDQLQPFSRRLCQEAELTAGTTLVHFSGLHPAAILARPNSDIGLLSLHPLLPFADRDNAARNLQDCPCTLEGDANRQALGLELIAAVGGLPFTLPAAAKPTYHAAASIASNFLVSLSASARDLIVASCGLDPPQAQQLLAPLQRATLDNLRALGPEQALTGPIVRGDAGTLALHLETLARQSPDLFDLYRRLARATLELACRSGRLSAEDAEPLRRLLDN